MLYAAVDQKLVTGPLTTFLVDLLLCNDTVATAARHEVSPAVLEAALLQLRTLGLRA